MHFRTTLIILLFLSASLLIGCIERGGESVNTPPMSSLSVSPFPSGYAPYNVTFCINAKDSDGYIVSWSLDVNNDGTPEFTGSGDELPKMINYTYTTAGNYTAKLIVTDNNGSTDESFVVITVLKPEENNPPVCSISANVTQGYAPLKVAFKANVEDDGYIVKYAWDFGDGTTSNQKDSFHVFTDAGVYNVTLTVEDNGGLTASAYILIEVLEKEMENNPPFCSVSASPLSGYAPLTVTFSLTAHDNDGYIVSWKLDVNNDGIAEYSGSGSPPETKQHTYENAGTYTANLTVIDDDGATAYATVQIVVNETQPSNQPPNADFTYSIDDLTVTFTDTSYDIDGSIVSWYWDFGDGNTSNQQNPVHTYADYGTYSVTLRVTDDDGAENETTVVITLEWQPEYGIKYKVHVVTVIDGDTFDVVFPNGSIERVRLLGVDCPEKSADDNKPGEYDDITDLECLAYWGIEAMNFTKSWLEGKDVYIEFDELAGFKGYYGRWLCYVYLLNDTDFNAELLKRGLARVYEEGECSKESYYLTLQQQAMDARVGLWSCMPESGGVVILTVHYDAAGNDWDNLNDEYVVIKNKGNEAVVMTGWTLSDEAGHVYIFPSGFILGAGATVTIYTGSGTDTQDKLYWGSDSPIWNNDGDTAYLRDNEGNLVDIWSW